MSDSRPSTRQGGNLPGGVEAYASVVTAYERGRPAYPAEAVQWVIEQASLGPGARVLDLAAGTGKLTRLLLGTEAEVVAVEPIKAFRETLRELGVAALEGSAEQIPLRDASVWTVTVAAAFHWFDAPRALTEIRRVLQPGGWLAILWNERDPADSTQRALTDLIEPHRAGEPRQSDEAWKGAFDRSSAFEPLRQRDFAHDHAFTPQTLTDRIASISFIAKLSQRERAVVLSGVHELATERGESFTLPHITHVYLTRRTA
jgi:SAM-dependent methyltransferase